MFELYLKILEGDYGLELMVKGTHQGKVVEYPIIFMERAAGESKMGWNETQRYIRHLLSLTLYKILKLLRIK